MSKKEEAIKLKMKMANAILSEVDVLMQHKFYNTAINRLYYGCFHATRALLLTKDLAPKTHKGIASLLHQEFVQKGEFDTAKALFFTRLMDERNTSDYGDFLIKDKDVVIDFIEPAKQYVTYIENLITNIHNS